MYFGLLNPNFLWKKRFSSRVSEIIYVFSLAQSKFHMEKEVWQPSFGDNAKKLSKSRVSVKNLRRKKKHCFHHIKNILFYIYWLAESKFVLEKEVWQPSFRDNAKKLSKSRVSVKNLRRKKKHCFHHIKNILFYIYWLAESKFVLEKEVWQPNFGDNLKNLLKSRISVENLEKKKKKHCFHHIKNTLFLCILAC